MNLTTNLNGFDLIVKRLQFNLLPKINRTNNPGRLVISSIYCLRSLISEYVGHCLQPYMQQLNSSLRHNAPFTNNERHSCPFGALIVTMDVQSFYTNIPS